MKNRNCPNKDACWDYNASRCEGCAVGEKIAHFARQNKKLKTENAQLRHRIEIVERALDKACEDIRKVIDCCWWAEKYIPEKVTPQAYIERSERERRSEQ